ncbi:MAG: hypothetical protein AAF280_00435 [Pseudomonadota bacterium]
MPEPNYYVQRVASAVATTITFATPSSISAENKHSLILTFEGQSIETALYFYTFPYRMESASIKRGKLYFSHHVEGVGKRLFVTDWTPDTSITRNSDTATKVTDIDLNTISFLGSTGEHPAEWPDRRGRLGQGRTHQPVALR